MTRYQFDNGLTIWYVKGPTMKIAIDISLPEGCHVEEEWPYEGREEDNPWPTSRFFFVVNTASGALVDYLRVVEAPGTNEWMYVD